MLLFSLKLRPHWGLNDIPWEWADHNTNRHHMPTRNIFFSRGVHGRSGSWCHWTSRPSALTVYAARKEGFTFKRLHSGTQFQTFAVSGSQVKRLNCNKGFVWCEKLVPSKERLHTVRFSQYSKYDMRWLTLISRRKWNARGFLLATRMWQWPSLNLSHSVT